MNECSDKGDLRLLKEQTLTVQDYVNMKSKVDHLEICLNLFAEDAHNFSTRPCRTCNTISMLLGKSFGCVKLSKGGV